MPSITYMWVPRQDANLISGIVDELKRVADAHDVSFYVNAKERDEKNLVVVNSNVSVPHQVVDRLHVLAKKAGVTIYVNPELAAL